MLRPGEVPIDIPLVRRLIAEQFPRWSHLPVTPVVKSGWDNATYRLGEQLSVRLPRLPRWVGQVEREQRWLPYLAPHLPLPIPQPVAAGVPSEDYPFPWSVYRWLDGTEATPGQVVDAAADLAAFFVALQAVDPSGGPPPGWSNGFRGTSFADERDSPVVAGRVRGLIAALDGLADTAALTAVYEAAAAAPAWAAPPVWVHGDPAPTNLLVDGGRVSAVIDFGTVAVGDPAVDLIVAWTVLDAAGRAAFRSALGTDDATWARGRGWGLVALLPSAADYDRSVDARCRLADLVADG